MHIFFYNENKEAHSENLANIEIGENFLMKVVLKMCLLLPSLTKIY